MDFDEAIKAHTYWKVTLRWMINGHQPLDAEALGRDDACEFGHWLKGEAAQRYRGLPAYVAVVHEHAAFHACCREVAQCVQRGELDRAHRMLAPDGEFTLSSASIVAAIRLLSRQAQAAG